MGRVMVGKKPYQRKQRVAVRIQQVLGQYLLTRALDPRIKGTTIIEVDCSPDLRQARIQVRASSLDDVADTMTGLRQASSHLRCFLAESLPLRIVPRLVFQHARIDHLADQDRLSQLLAGIDPSHEQELPHGQAAG